MNKVIFNGNLCRDPEIRHTQSGSVICEINVAINERWKTQSGEDKEKTSFIDVTFFGKGGESLAKHFTKGSKILIEGKLSMDSWDDKETGRKRTKLSIIGNNWEFQDSKGANQQASKPSQSFQPQQPQKPAFQPPPATAFQAPPAMQSTGIDDQDVPF